MTITSLAAEVELIPAYTYFLHVDCIVQLTVCLVPRVFTVDKLHTRMAGPMGRVEK